MKTVLKWFGIVIGAIVGIFILLAILATLFGGGEKEPSQAPVAKATVTGTVSPTATPSPKPSPTATPSPKPTPTATPRPTATPTPTAKWNMNDPDALTNGNIPIAIKLLKPLTVEDVKQNAEGASPQAMNKAPWNYYGKIIGFKGAAFLVQDYPPGSDVGKLFGGQVGEIVLVVDDLTIVDYLHMGSSGDIIVGDMVNVFGYPVGRTESRINWAVQPRS